MEKQELISVIIPVYNVEKYLKECVDSVLKQSYQNFEVILVDDGSTDSSGKICDKYVELDNRIKVIHKENAGASATRNVGIKEAKGNYLYFLDSDDWLDSTTLEKLIGFIINEQADVVFFDAYTVDEVSGNVSKKNYSHKKVYSSGIGWEVMGELLDNKDFKVSPCLMLYRKSFIQNSKLSFEEGIMYEDMIFAYKVFIMAKKVAYLPEYLYFRRYRANSVMTTKISKRNYTSARIVFDRISEFADKAAQQEVNIFRKYIVRCVFNVFNLYNKLSKLEQNEFKHDYITFRKNVIQNKGYGDKALLARCYGVFPWFCYKIAEKVFSGFLKG